MRRDEELFARYGPAKALALARFIAVVRSLLNPVAGALHTPVRTFSLWQVVCGTSGPTAVYGQFAGGTQAHRWCIRRCRHASFEELVSFATVRVRLNYRT